jgi:hypothetical protein
VVEHFLGKEEVKGSIPFNGSFFDKLRTTNAKSIEVMPGSEQDDEESA